MLINYTLHIFSVCFFSSSCHFRRFLETACGQTVNEKPILVSATELLSGAATADETHMNRGAFNIVGGVRTLAEFLGVLSLKTLEHLR